MTEISKYMNMGTLGRGVNSDLPMFTDDPSGGRRENPSRRAQHRRIDPVATDDQIGGRRSGVKSSWHGPLSMVCTIIMLVLL